MPLIEQDEPTAGITPRRVTLAISRRESARFSSLILVVSWETRFTWTDTPVRKQDPCREACGV